MDPTLWTTKVGWYVGTDVVELKGSEWGSEQAENLESLKANVQVKSMGCSNTRVWVTLVFVLMNSKRLRSA